MACSLTYDGTLSRVRITATGLNVTGTASYATVERSDDGGSTFTIIRGATSVPVTGGATQLTTDDYEFPPNVPLTYRVRGYTSGNVMTSSFTCSTTVTQPAAWLKSVERPFLNRALTCVLNPSPLDRAGRAGIFDILDRSFPVALGDVRLGYEYDLVIVSTTYDEQVALDYLLASGDTLYLQLTDELLLDGMFIVITGDTQEQRPVRNRDCGYDFRRFRLPVVQVADPDSDVVGVTASWYTVILTYATWSAVIAANATWASLLTNLVASPSEVIIP